MSRRTKTFTKEVEVTGYACTPDGEEHELTTYVTVDVDMSAYELLEEINDDELRDECSERGIYIEPYEPFEADKPGEDITNEELELMIAMLHELKKPSLVEQFLAEKLSNIRYVWK